MTKYDGSRRWAIYWLPAVAWLLTVALFSSASFGAGNTGGVLQSILDLLHIRLSAPHFLTLHYLVRKCAHFTAYGILSALFFRAVRASDAARLIWKARYALIALGVCLLTSAGDEIHQSFTPGRTGTWHDVVLDMVGAAFVQAAILFVLSTRRAQRRWATASDRGTSSSTIAAATARLAEK